MESSARTDTVAFGGGGGWWNRRAELAAANDLDMGDFEFADPVHEFQFQQHQQNRYVQRGGRGRDEQRYRWMGEITGRRPRNDDESDEIYEQMTEAQKRELMERNMRRTDAEMAQTRGWGKYGDGYRPLAFFSEPRRQQDVNGNVDIIGDTPNRRLEVMRQRVDLEARRHVGPNGLPEELLQRIFPDEPNTLRPVNRNHPAYNRVNADRIRNMLRRGNKKK